ncbi:hypothetical protein P8C59_003392 [Phyllachora maydis]|uniref:Uncharacterized protein n=1 Tax=Phyllachora maydis TaxID=1825666 RepID=A0AAD9I1C7_9PEZI|nr:hypothetical protein P8C59_003392 [Phyllachora maydis]
MKTGPVLGALAGAAGVHGALLARQTFGNALSTGPVAAGNFIREANTTLLLPATNTPQISNLALWPGMATDQGDLIQGLAISVADGSVGCPPASGMWCLCASTLEGTQQRGATVPAAPGSAVTFGYRYDDTTARYEQTVALDGTVVSTLSVSRGVAQGWGTAAECQMSSCGTVPGHRWVRTTLVMDQPDPDYDQTKRTTGATGDMESSDGGRTWTIADIEIDWFTFS